MSFKLILSLALVGQFLAIYQAKSELSSDVLTDLKENWSKFETDFKNSIETVQKLNLKSNTVLLLEQVARLYQFNQFSLKEGITLSADDKERFVNFINELRPVFENNSAISDMCGKQSAFFAFIYSTSVNFGLVEAMVQLWNQASGNKEEIQELIPSLSEHHKFPEPLLSLAARQLFNWRSQVDDGSWSMQNHSCFQRFLYNLRKAVFDYKDRPFLINHLKHIADGEVSGAVYRCLRQLSEQSVHSGSANDDLTRCIYHTDETNFPIEDTRKIIFFWRKNLLLDSHKPINIMEHTKLDYYRNMFMLYYNEDFFNSKLYKDMQTIIEKDIAVIVAEMFERIDRLPGGLDSFGEKFAFVQAIVKDITNTYRYDEDFLLLNVYQLLNAHIYFRTIHSPNSQDKHYLDLRNELFERFAGVIRLPPANEISALGRYLSDLVKFELPGEFIGFHKNYNNEYSKTDISLDDAVQDYLKEKIFPAKPIVDNYQAFKNLLSSSQYQVSKYPITYERLKSFYDLAESIDWPKDVLEDIAIGLHSSFLLQCQGGEIIPSNEMLKKILEAHSFVKDSVWESTSNSREKIAAKTVWLILSSYEDSVNSDRLISELMPICEALRSSESCVRQATIACDEHFAIFDINPSSLSSDICKMADIYKLCLNLTFGSNDEKSKSERELLSVSIETTGLNN